jgi:26S proteasome regulatory subunit N7
LIEEGGDWDLINRLKVYRALNLLNSRQFKTAGELLIDSLSTFTASELIDYNDFVGLAIIVNVLVLKRVDLKKKVYSNLIPRHLSCTRHCLLTRVSGHEQIIASPEVTGVIQDVPLFGNYLMSIYDCNYAKFFVALGALCRTQ